MRVCVNKCICAHNCVCLRVLVGVRRSYGHVRVCMCECRYTHMCGCIVTSGQLTCAVCVCIYIRMHVAI